MINNTLAPVFTQLRIANELPDLETAILCTVAYSDVFDYPLKGSEIARYLVGCYTTQEEVEAALLSGTWKTDQLRFTRGYFTLAGREYLVDRRNIREQASRSRWSAAKRYGSWIAVLPFVRMVAVTGALAVSNEIGPDLDYMIVTKPGRVWMCRGMVMLLGRWARRFGDEICPNYFLAESALELSDQNLYTAHEMAQMIPLSGMDIYHRMRRLNPWVEFYLPNATGMPPASQATRIPSSVISTTRRVAEGLLSTPPGDWVETWEMRRKVLMLHSQASDSSETSFCPEWCKGHFGGYARKTRDAYHARLHALGLTDGLWELG